MRMGYLIRPFQGLFRHFLINLRTLRGSNLLREADAPQQILETLVRAQAIKLWLDFEP